MSVSSELADIGNGGAIAINGTMSRPVTSPTNTRPVPERLAEFGSQSHVKCSGTTSPGVIRNPAAWLMFVSESAAEVAVTNLKSAWADSSSATSVCICRRETLRTVTDCNGPARCQAFDLRRNKDAISASNSTPTRVTSNTATIGKMM